ncbi:MAG: hypothetical protein SFY56_03145 [Bacteroidota bacterium]|nr:hypothetical protein [Bacteroidota bacterium]
MRQNFVYLIVISFLLGACKQNRMDVDISDIKIKPIETLRLENDLFSLNEANYLNKTNEIKNKYGAFYDRYVFSFLNKRGAYDSTSKPAILKFIADKDMRNAYNYVKFIYTDSKIQELNEEINECAKRFKYHFPKKSLPNKLVTCTNCFNYSVAYVDSNLVVGLDNYLGDTAIFYQMLQLPQYKTRCMNQNYILPDLVRGWLLTEFDNAEPVNTLLFHTIFYGKLYYCMSALLPETPDSLLIGYTKQQLTYCKANEKNAWSFFAEKNRLYENNLKIVQELTAEGPFTGAISRQCPPRIAMWVGWQIVKSYMDKNENVTLEQLMMEKDAQKILSKSKYRP